MFVFFENPCITRTSKLIILQNSNVRGLGSIQIHACCMHEEFIDAGIDIPMCTHQIKTITIIGFRIIGVLKKGNIKEVFEPSGK